MTTGSSGKPRREIRRRSRQILGREETIEDIGNMAGLGSTLENLISIVVVAWERSKEMKGVNAMVKSRHWRVLRPGSNGVVRVWCCSTERASGDGGIDAFGLSVRILRAYF